MLKTLLRPAMIFIPFLAGFLFPQAHILNEAPVHFISWSLMTMLFLSCLQLRFSELKPRREHWIILALNLLMGIVPYFLFRIFLPESPEYAQIAFFVGITPTATAAPVVVAFLNGRIGFALTGFTITNVFIALSLPGLLPLVTGNFSLAFIGDAGLTLFRIIVLPFLCAVLVRKICPAVQNLPKKCKLFTFSLWSMNLFVIAASTRQYFMTNPGEHPRKLVFAALISLVLCIVSFLAGQLFSRHRFCRESSQILGQKNTMLSMYLALHYASSLVAMGPIFYILWHNSWNAIQMYRYDRRKIRKKLKHQNYGTIFNSQKDKEYGK